MSEFGYPCKKCPKGVGGSEKGCAVDCERFKTWATSRHATVGLSFGEVEKLKNAAGLFQVSDPTRFMQGTAG